MTSPVQSGDRRTDDWLTDLASLLEADMDDHKICRFAESKSGIDRTKVYIEHDGHGTTEEWNGNTFGEFTTDRAKVGFDLSFSVTPENQAETVKQLEWLTSRIKNLKLER